MNASSLRAALAAALLVTTIAPPQADAFSLFRGGGGPADLLAEPDRFLSFDPGVITWKMDSEFRSVYDTPVLQNQVRQAFAEWENASLSPARRSVNRYRWTRFSGNQPTIDLMSIMVHEIGHSIGFQHADAAWFNETDPNGNAWNRNYRMLDGELVAAPPVGGEVMNEGNQLGFLPDNASPKGIRGGEYWRTVSKDEVHGLDYMYGAPLDFQEVGPNDEAMISVEIFQGNGGGNLGVSGPDSSTLRDPGDASAGRLITAASIGISNNANMPIGVMPRTSGWNFSNNTGEAIKAISVRTDGTRTREALYAFSNGSNRFNTYDPSNAVLLHDFENRGHIFSDPSGGSIPANNGSVQFGAQLDVWDWTVDRATARTVDDEPIPLSMVSLMGWSNGGFENPDLPPPDAPSPIGAAHACEHCGHHHGPGGHDRGDHGHGDGHRHGMTTTAGEYTTLNNGFRVAAGDTPGVLTELAFASVAGLDLDGDDLTAETLRSLDEAGELVRLPIDPIGLEAYDELIVVLDGVVDDLPEDLRDAGRYFLHQDPRFAKALEAGEVLVYGSVEGEAGTVGAFSLLNEASIVGRRVPEPAAALLVLIACSGVGFRRRRAA